MKPSVRGGVVQVLTDWVTNQRERKTLSTVLVYSQKSYLCLNLRQYSLINTKKKENIQTKKQANKVRLNI